VLQRTRARRLTLLDVASATGDIPRTIQLQLGGRGIEFKYSLLDRDSAHFHGTGASARVRGDALMLPFRDNSFDLVSCSLFAHHLDQVQLMRFAQEALRVSRTAVLINDLRRSYVHLAAIYAGLPLFRHITRHDAPVSVWRSYTVNEMKDILSRVGANRVQMQTSYLFRMGAIVWK